MRRKREREEERYERVLRRERKERERKKVLTIEKVGRRQYADFEQEEKNYIRLIELSINLSLWT